MVYLAHEDRGCGPEGALRQEPGKQTEPMLQGHG